MKKAQPAIYLDKQTESDRPSEKPKPYFQTAPPPIQPAAETARTQKGTTHEPRRPTPCQTPPNHARTQPRRLDCPVRRPAFVRIPARTLAGAGVFFRLHRFGRHLGRYRRQSRPVGGQPLLGTSRTPAPRQRHRITESRRSRALHRLAGRRTAERRGGGRGGRHAVADRQTPA